MEEVRGAFQSLIVIRRLNDPVDDQNQAADDEDYPVAVQQQNPGAVVEHIPAAANQQHPLAHEEMIPAPEEAPAARNQLAAAVDGGDNLAGGPSNQTHWPQ